MKKDNTKKSVKLVVKALNGILRTEANSTSCYIVYQPKAPESLSRFRRNK